MIQTFKEYADGISAFLKLCREGRLKDLSRLDERGKISGLFQITRFRSDLDVRLGRPYDVGKPFPNIFVNGGLALMWSLATGQGGTSYSNANANLGVGDSNAAPAVGQTDLQAATNKLRKAMNATYPLAPVNGLEQWQSDFTGAEANYSWQEFAIFNAAAAGTMLNRSISNQGTKTSGQTWRLTYSFTLS
jgi:hypothetical protein